MHLNAGSTLGARPKGRICIFFSGLAYPFEEGPHLQFGYWLEILNESGYAVSLLYTTSTRSKFDKAEFLRNFSFLESAESIGPSLNYAIDLVLTPALVRVNWRRIDALVRRDGADVILAIGLPWAIALRRFRRLGRLVYTSLDSYSLRFRQLADLQSGLARTRSLIALSVAAWIERAFFTVPHKVFVVGAGDAQYLEEMIGIPVPTVPLISNMAFGLSMCASTKRPVDVLVIGNLRSEAVLLGVKLFLGKVAPALKQSGCSVLVQSRAEEIVLQLGRQHGDIVHFTGAVDDFDGLLQSAKIAVIPDLYGTGQKNRVIEAIANGCAVISTVAGADGMGFENGLDIVVCEKPDDMAKAALKLLSDERRRLQMVNCAQDRLRQLYSRSAVALRLLEMVEY